MKDRARESPEVDAPRLSDLWGPGRVRTGGIEAGVTWGLVDKVMAGPPSVVVAVPAEHPGAGKSGWWWRRHGSQLVVDDMVVVWATYHRPWLSTGPVRLRGGEPARMSTLTEMAQLAARTLAREAGPA